MFDIWHFKLADGETINQILLFNCLLGQVFGEGIHEGLCKAWEGLAKGFDKGSGKGSG